MDDRKVIYLDDAIDAVSKACQEFRGIFGRCENGLLALPSVQPERKTGRWEYVDYGGFGNWHCTVCRKIAIVNGNEDYCPNCGSKMEVEHDGGRS